MLHHILSHPHKHIEEGCSLLLIFVLVIYVHLNATELHSIRLLLYRLISLVQHIRNIFSPSLNNISMKQYFILLTGFNILLHILSHPHKHIEEGFSILFIFFLVVYVHLNAFELHNTYLLLYRLISLVQHI